MEYIAVVYKLEGGKELKWDWGNDTRFDVLFQQMRKATAIDEPEVIFNGPYDLDKILDIIGTPKGYATYAMFRSHGYAAFSPEERLNVIREDAKVVNWPRLIENAFYFQIIEMGYLSGDGLL